MKDIVFIGDIHGLNVWRDIVNRHSECLFVFIGDYVDSYDISAEVQINNLKNIIEFKKQNNDNVILLIGNHDIHYFENYHEQCSGYQYQYAQLYKDIYKENKDLFQLCFLYDNILCTHAGVSIEFLKLLKYDYKTPIDQFLNQTFKSNIEYFHFDYFQHIYLDYYGNNTWQSPVWIRPLSLQRANKSTLRTEYIQIVGHTRQDKILTDGKTTGNRYYYIDCLFNGEYLIYNIDTKEFKSLDLH